MRLKSDNTRKCSVEKVKSGYWWSHSSVRFIAAWHFMCNMTIEKNDFIHLGKEAADVSHLEMINKGKKTGTRLLCRFMITSLWQYTFADVMNILNGQFGQRSDWHVPTRSCNDFISTVRENLESGPSFGHVRLARASSGPCLSQHCWWMLVLSLKQFLEWTQFI